MRGIFLDTYTYMWKCFGEISKSYFFFKPRQSHRHNLAFIILLYVKPKFIHFSNFWSISRWEDAFVLALTLAAIYGCLEGPHMVHDSRSCSWFFFHTVHKFLVVFVIAMALVYFSYLGQVIALISVRYACNSSQVIYLQMFQRRPFPKPGFFH